MQRTPLVIALLALPAASALAESSPYYIGTSLGLTHVSNLYRTATSGASDTVTSLGVLGGLDQQIGRQRLMVDGSIQDNRYSTNSNLNNSSYSLHSGLDWQTVGGLSGSLNATSSRTLADFNVGSGISQIFVKNTQRDNEYSAVARLGVFTRYTLEAGFNRRTHDFSAIQYAQLVYRQNAGSLGLYATPGANLRIGLVARHTEGLNPTYPTISPLIPIYSPNDYRRNDVDLTLSWNTGGASSLNARISASRSNNSLSQVNDFSGTTGALGWTWQAFSKLQLSAQFARDSGQETTIRASDVNRVYTSWQLGSAYAMSAKVSVNASVSGSRSNWSDNSLAAASDSHESNRNRTLGIRWAYSRSFSLGCQYNYANRNSSTASYSYSSNSYGCTGQALLY